MHPTSRFTLFIAATLLVLPAALAQDPPGVYATDREKLDYLFESWRGRSEETLKSVWGREESLRDRGTTKTYQFQRSKRGPAIGLGGVRVIGRGVITCTAYFQLGLEDIVTRATWRGPTADDCWALFRDYAPPAPPA